MMIFDVDAISTNHCAQRRHSLRPKLISPISRFAIAAKMIRYCSEDDSPVHIKAILSHGIEANFSSKTPYS